MNRLATHLIQAGLALVLAAPAGPLAGQSMLGAGGLGVPIDALGARERAIGGVGVGLFGPAIRPGDPAAAVGFRVPVVSLTMQPTTVKVESDFVRSEASGNRFPVLGVAYPVSGYGTATLSFGSVLDQRWDVLVERDVDVGGGEIARVTDTFVSDGGVNALRVGFARRVRPDLAVGLAVGGFTGGVDRTFRRRFDSLSVDVPDLEVAGVWSFSGPTVVASAIYDLSDAVRLGGAVTWAGSLAAEASDETDGVDDDFDIPTLFRVGASGVLALDLVASVGGSWADWSDAGKGPLPGGGGRAAASFGGGFEWTGATLLSRVAPFRVGYQWNQLPFLFQGEEASESAWTVGLGLHLAEAADGPSAAFDFALERGDRSAADVVESFWRASFSLRVSGGT